MNGLLVLCLPWIAAAFLGLSGHDTSVVVHPAGWSPWLAAIRDFIIMAPLLLPGALVASWRTWVHSGRWLGGDRSWQGIFEAGLFAFAVALLLLVAGIGVNMIRRPILAWEYVMFYGAFASILGLGVGLILQITAMIVLTLSRLVTPTRIE